MMNASPAMYNQGHPILIRECDFTAAQLEIINRTGIEEKLRNTKCIGNSANLVVAKLDTPVSSLMEVEQASIDPKETVDTLTEEKNCANLSEGNNEKVDGPDQQILSLVVMRKKKVANQNEEVQSSTLPGKEAKSGPNSSVALCFMCGKKFSSNYNLKRHMNSCKLCPEYERGPRYHCQCGRSYSQEWDMKKHKASCTDNGKKCKKCLIPDCNLLFYHRAQLASHMKNAHSVNIQDPEVLEFESMDDFRLWKEREEEETYTYYSKQTGANVTGVSVNTYYVCQHDGSDRAHGSNPRKTERRNKKGRVKVGRLCWSQMNVKEFWDGTVRVTYYPSHTHSISAADTEHHPLPSSIHSEIKRRLSELKTDTEDTTTTEFSEFKKPRKRSYGVTLRTLRSLARKNRKLFRITAEAVEDADEMKERQQKNVVIEQPVPPQEAPLVLIPPAGVKNEMEKDRQRMLLESCDSHWQQIRTLIDSGKLRSNVLAQVESTLSSLLESCREETVQPEGENSSLCELTEVIYQSETLSSNNFPIAKDGIELDSMDKTVYQVVTLEPKEEPASPPSQELLYQNSVELVTPREFIIIANDHAQIFVNPA